MKLLAILESSCTNVDGMLSFLRTVIIPQELVLGHLLNALNHLMHMLLVYLHPKQY